MKRHSFAPTGDRPVLRMLLLMGVFACVAAAFWWHFGQRMAALAHPTLRDPAKALRMEDVTQLKAQREAFKRTLGMDIYVLVERDALRLPHFEPGSLFVGVGLAHHEAVIVLPPLARRALGEGARMDAETALGRCLNDEAPGPCLIRTLETLRQALSNPSEKPHPL